MQTDTDTASHALQAGGAHAVALGVATCVRAEILIRAKPAVRSGRRQGAAGRDADADRSSILRRRASRGRKRHPDTDTKSGKDHSGADSFSCPRTL